MRDKYPARDTMPAWYELAVKDAGTLILRIHRLAMNFLIEKIKEDAPIIEHYKEKFPDNPSLKSFILPKINGSWGFGEVLVATEADENWATYELRLPILSNKSGHSVEMKTDSFALRATLSVVLTALILFEGDTGCKIPQLMVVEHLIADMGWHNAGLSITLTPTVSRWLSRQRENSHLKEVEDAMRDVGYHLWPSKDYHRLYKHDFRAWCRQPKWINISVPGDACGLDPDYHDSESEYGYRLSPHNMDNSWQQFMMLAGLAKLQDIIRREAGL